MGLFGNSQSTGNGLMPNGVGGGVSAEQQALFSQAAKDSGYKVALTGDGAD